jgi:uncharacterized MAPEG superfamily protein
MNTELQLLFFSILLGGFHILAAAGAATRVRGVKWNLSSRGEPAAPLTGMPGRLSRAAENFKETFPFFLAAVFLVHTLGKSSGLSVLGAHLYFWGRLLYLPIYAFDITRIRTVVWSVAMSGIVLLLVAPL